MIVYSICETGVTIESEAFFANEAVQDDNWDLESQASGAFQQYRSLAPGAISDNTVLL